MAPRRSHKKSRAGCRRCKSRKIKCDEARPRCANCDKHGVTCDYECPELAAELAITTTTASTPRLSPASARSPASPPSARLLARAKLSATTNLSPLCVSPSPVSSLTSTTPSSPAGRLLELRLLHHFTTVTFKTLSSTNERVEAVWRDFVPRTAFAAACGSVAPASNHLTDSILAIAALHLRTLAPNDRELVNASHAYMASSLTEYNRLLQQGINHDNAVTLFLNSALISFQAAAARIFSKEEPTPLTDNIQCDFASSLDSSLDSSSAFDSVLDSSMSSCDPFTIDPSMISYASPPSTMAAVTPNSSINGSNCTNGTNGNGTNGNGSIGTNGSMGTNGSNIANSSATSSTSSGGYGVPLSWFHAFQGVKTITAVSWQWLRSSDIVLSIINAQPPLHLDILSAQDGFFGHLLDGLDEELAGLAGLAPSPTASDGFLYPDPASPNLDDFLQDAATTAFPPSPGADATRNDIVARTRHAYLHAVAVLNWAHKSPYNGACLVFPATVSRHFVDLLSSRSHRAITILACFFAMLKTLDRVWWLQGMARREVLGVVSLFNSDAVPVDVERRWWPHLQWAVRVALYHDDDDSVPSDYIPPEVWGCDAASYFEESDGSLSTAATGEGTPDDFGSHIDRISESISCGGSSPEFNYPSLL